MTLKENRRRGRKALRGSIFKIRLAPQDGLLFRVIAGIPIANGSRLRAERLLALIQAGYLIEDAWRSGSIPFQDRNQLAAYAPVPSEAGEGEIPETGLTLFLRVAEADPLLLRDVFAGGGATLRICRVRRLSALANCALGAALALDRSRHNPPPKASESPKSGNREPSQKTEIVVAATKPREIGTTDLTSNQDDLLLALLGGAVLGND
jgi:hypothetical protein